MKTKLLISVIAIMAIFSLKQVLGQDKSYQQLWKQVEEAKRKDHPKTVVEICNKIIEKAHKDGDKGQLLKAYFYNAENQIFITPDTLYSRLKELEGWAAKEEDPATKMVLHSCIASVYANYAANNAWQLKQRTNISGGEDSQDVEQWGSAKFVETVNDNVNASLADIELLRKTDNGQFVPFVVQGADSKNYSHDLLHVMMQRAVDILGNVFSIAKDKKALRTRQMEIFQQTIECYRRAGDTEGYVLSTLAMLENEREDNLSEKNYIKALEKLLDEDGVAKTPVSTEILIELAKIVVSDNPAKALEYCERGIKDYSGYKRVSYLKSFKKNILAPDVNADFPSYPYPGSKESIVIRHKNIDKVQFIIYRIPESLHDKLNNRSKLKDSDLSQCAQVSSKTFSLQRPADYKMASERVEMEMPAEPGIYTCKMVANGKDVFSWNILRAGRLKLLYSSSEPRKLEVIVVDRKTGAPVAGAEASLQFKTRYDKEFEEISQRSNKDGKLTFEIGEAYKNVYSTMLKACKDDDRYMAYTSVSISSSMPNLEHYGSGRLTLITDRSLYRPGQTVYVKGISYYEKGDNANVQPGKKYKIQLKNSNREVVDTKEVVTNEFGSFEVSLTIPSSGLMGFYTVQNSTGLGKLDIRVEEYKRPTFEVKADSPEDTFRIGDKVTIKAEAKTFSGIPVDEADVKYTLVRRQWCWWSLENEDIIEEGTVKTDGKGCINLPVTLEAEDNSAYFQDLDLDDEEALEKANTYYSYQLRIDVTNAAGETQGTSAYIYAGYKGLVLDYVGSRDINKLKPVSISLSATNFAGNPIDVNVSWQLWTTKDGNKDNKIKEGRIKANTDSDMPNWRNLPSGKYILTYSTTDPKGEKCEGAKSLTLFSPEDKSPVEDSKLWTYRDGDYIWYGTSFENATVFIDVYSENRVRESQVIHLSNQILKKKFVYSPEYGDGATINLRMVRNDVLFSQKFSVAKPHNNPNLTIKWSTFRNTLVPGQKEEWRMTVLTPEGKPAEAEVLAFMYDASLDKIYPHSAAILFHNFPRKITDVLWRTNNLGGFTSYSYSLAGNFYSGKMDFDYFIPVPQLLNTYSYNYRYMSKSMAGRAAGAVESVAAHTEEADFIVTESAVDSRTERKSETAEKQNTGNKQLPEEAGPVVRTNFNETAFFLPQLLTDKDGNVSISFTLPESLTRWRFISRAHTKDWMTGHKDDYAEARKDFMISPFMPRFLRSGDKTTIASTLNNLSEKDIEAIVKFEMFDPATEKIFHTQKQKVKAAKGKTSKVSFSFDVEDTYDVVGVRIVAEGGQFSDGEQHLLAVLSNKTRLVESVALPIRGNQTKEFSLEKLFNHHSPTATKKTLTIEFTGNPAWYAVQALPSLAEPDDDCAICWTNALYANVLASAIANSQPKIKNVYDSWKKSGQNKETLLSNLQKNQELKNVLLSESPWVLEAKNEEDQKNMISALFDVIAIGNTKDKAIKKLRELQMPDGGWTWFKGMESSPWITEYVLTQDIRLKILTGEKMDSEREGMHQKGLDFMHDQAQKEYDWIKKENIKSKGVSYFILKYFYLVSLEAQASGTANPIDLVPQKRRTMYNWFLNKVAEAPKSQDMQEKAMAAVVLKAHGKQKLANEYMQSIREHLTSSDELGMYFAFNQNPYRWGSMNLNAQVAAIEAFDQVAQDKQTVEEMKIWLLKQKQTQMWGTSPMTADAIFALLARGDNWLESQGNVDLSFAGRTINTTKPDEEGNAPVPGLNYIKRAYTDKESTEAQTITVSKNDKGIAWGAAYATFFEKIANVKENGSKEMSITKELFVKRVNTISETATSSKDTKNGKLAYTLEPLKNGAKIKVGDIVTARMVIKIDRTMDFVQLKEMRAACFEPLSQLSGYRRGGGASYYEEIKDAATNFFFYSLGKGTYVLEVNYRASRAGEYEAGLATLQCAYAPEYTAHTGSCRITVTE